MTDMSPPARTLVAVSAGAVGVRLPQPGRRPQAEMSIGRRGRRARSPRTAGAERRRDAAPAHRLGPVISRGRSGCSSP
jgi:hypothetical protein